MRFRVRHWSFEIGCGFFELFTDLHVQDITKFTIFTCIVQNNNSYYNIHTENKQNITKKTKYKNNTFIYNLMSIE